MNDTITVERAVVTNDSVDGYVVYAQDIRSAQAGGTFIGGYTLDQAYDEEGDPIPGSYIVSDGQDAEVVIGAAAALRTFAEYMDDAVDDLPALQEHINQARTDADALEGVIVS